MTDNQPIQSFSGTHPYDVSVLQFMPTEYLQSIAGQFDSPSITAEWLRESAIEMIDERIKQGQCPRCTRSLANTLNPTWKPAGSHITKCRSVPICSLCGTHEAIEQMTCGLTPPELWRLLTPLKVRRRVSKWSRENESHMPSLADCHAIVAERGGWAEFGNTIEN